MENVWLKAHKVILESEVGDFYESGGQIVTVIKRTKKRIYYDNGNCVTLKKVNNFYYLSGKNINQILRDIEGYIIYKLHC